MESPLRITWQGVARSDAIEAAVRRHVDELERFYDRITACRVVVRSPHRHHRKGKLYVCRIDLSVPRKEIVVNEDRHDKHAHEDVYVAINDAFKAATRRLADHARRLRGDVKRHAYPPHGRILRLFPREEGESHGFIQTADGREIYFHENGLVDVDFDALEVGTEVRFAEHAGVEGPTASSVRPSGRHHHLL